MPNDAKLGLVVGVGVVLAVAVIFFRQEQPAPAAGKPVGGKTAVLLPTPAMPEPR